MISNIVMILAIVLAGEAGPVDAAVPVIAHSVMNRVASDAFPGTVLAVLEDGYNGRGTPTALHVTWARIVLRRRGDPTGGILYVISREDVELLNCGPGDVVFVEGPWEVHGYREWCAGKGE